MRVYCGIHNAVKCEAQIGRSLGGCSSVLQCAAVRALQCVVMLCTWRIVRRSLVLSDLFIVSRSLAHNLRSRVLLRLLKRLVL